MEALKAEIARKKRSASEMAQDSSQNKKWVRKRDLEQARIEENLRAQKELDAKKLASRGEQESLTARQVDKFTKTSMGVPGPAAHLDESALAAEVDTSKSREDEPDEAYRSADSAEDNLHKGKRKRKAKTFEMNADGTLPQTAFSSQGRWPAEKVVLRFFQMLLDAWGWDVEHSTAAAKQSQLGQRELRGLQQCREHIHPLFQLCRRREVPPDILEQLTAIVMSCEKGDFKTANDHYLKAAIGNEPWPIGLTMVGIHERSGREKISTANVAHVMNNEQQRKYFTSIKRLIGYMQRKRTDVAPSMKVL